MMQAHEVSCGQPFHYCVGRLPPRVARWAILRRQKQTRVYCTVSRAAEEEFKCFEEFVVQLQDDIIAVRSPCNSDVMRMRPKLACSWVYTELQRCSFLGR